MTETEETLVYDAMIEIHEASTVLAALVNLDGTAAARKAYKSGVYGPCVKLQCALGQKALERGKARTAKDSELCSTAPATAYRDAEGWALFDVNQNVVEDWPASWPKTVNCAFLKTQNVRPVR